MSLYNWRCEFSGSCLVSFHVGIIETCSVSTNACAASDIYTCDDVMPVIEVFINKDLDFWL